MKRYKTERLARFIWKTINDCSLKNYLNPRSNLGGSSTTNVKQQFRRDVLNMQRLLNKVSKIFRKKFDFIKLMKQRCPEGMKWAGFKVQKEKRG